MTADGQDAERFDAAIRLSGLSLRQLWLRYVALGGNADVFDVEAFLQGLGTLASFERDVLAHAVNERLQEVLVETELPYLDPGPDLPGREDDPVDVLTDLLEPDQDQEPGRGSNPDPKRGTDQDRSPD
ncbi:hypothetical protein [Microlunatus soli]|uniref:Uncharacterized protein n=1 Tax=Microlunatus soli TaxID=630515 RepID=A0A1H1N7W3_9ACTN|nr:hypothetical protein [Microlunatus soli]SDR95017.1 hypothetical protein SAMN04489812_0413 [Microlunatus soli]